MATTETKAKGTGQAANQADNNHMWPNLHMTQLSRFRISSSNYTMPFSIPREVKMKRDCNVRSHLHASQKNQATLQDARFRRLSISLKTSSQGSKQQGNRLDGNPFCDSCPGQTYYTADMYLVVQALLTALDPTLCIRPPYKKPGPCIGMRQNA